MPGPQPSNRSKANMTNPDHPTSTFKYEGYAITSRMGADGIGVVQVFDPRDKHGPVIYATTSLDRASKWVDAYIAGQQWAVDERLDRKRAEAKAIVAKLETMRHSLSEICAQLGRHPHAHHESMAIAKAADSLRDAIEWINSNNRGQQ